MELKMVPSVGASAVSFRHSAMAASYWPLEANSWAFCRTVRRSTGTEIPTPTLRIHANSLPGLCQNKWENGGNCECGFESGAAGRSHGLSMRRRGRGSHGEAGQEVGARSFKTFAA